ncbi:MAG: 50S ribosomal protein L32 [Patescibacteria group bacterium]|nr:50S ribosomal protein L32 [Patescibacteria group bacterium]
MSVPTKRRTSSQGKRRASHHRLKAAPLSACAGCGAAVAPHRVCPACGEYKKRPAKAAAKSN